MSQSVSNTAPWDQPFLPPAPEWNGASRALLADASNPWVTDFERDPAHDFSPDYADTRAWFDRLDAASDLIRIEQFGVSPEGRPIYAVIASKDGATLDPAKPVLLAQAGIHPGRDRRQGRGHDAAARHRLRLARTTCSTAPTWS